MILWLEIWEKCRCCKGTITSLGSFVWASEDGLLSSFVGSLDYTQRISLKAYLIFMTTKVSTISLDHFATSYIWPHVYTSIWNILQWNFLTHAQAVNTRPYSILGRGLETRIVEHYTLPSSVCVCVLGGGGGEGESHTVGKDILKESNLARQPLLWKNQERV